MKKNILSQLILFFCGFLLSCRDDGMQPDFAGKWNVTSDFFYQGVGLTNHAVTYAGLPGDYFNFSANGILYIKEGATLDTLSFKVLSTSAISIGATPNFDTYQIQNFSTRSVTLNWPGIITPGGKFARKIVLQR